VVGAVVVVYGVVVIGGTGPGPGLGQRADDPA